MLLDPLGDNLIAQGQVPNKLSRVWKLLDVQSFCVERRLEHSRWRFSLKKGERKGWPWNKLIKKERKHSMATVESWWLSPNAERVAIKLRLCHQLVAFSKRGKWICFFTKHTSPSRRIAPSRAKTFFSLGLPWEAPSAESNPGSKHSMP